VVAYYLWYKPGLEQLRATIDPLEASYASLEKDADWMRGEIRRLEQANETLSHGGPVSKKMQGEGLLGTVLLAMDTAGSKGLSGDELLGFLYVCMSQYRGRFKGKYPLSEEMASYLTDKDAEELAKIRNMEERTGKPGRYTATSFTPEELDAYRSKREEALARQWYGLSPIAPLTASQFERYFKTAARYRAGGLSGLMLSSLELLEKEKVQLFLSVVYRVTMADTEFAPEEELPMIDLDEDTPSS